MKASHNPEVAGSNPAPAIGRSPLPKRASLVGGCSSCAGRASMRHQFIVLCMESTSNPMQAPGSSGGVEIPSQPVGKDGTTRGQLEVGSQNHGGDNLGLLACPARCRAPRRSVRSTCAEFASIQAAVGAAAPGDRVAVRARDKSYLESVEARRQTSPSSAFREDTSSTVRSQHLGSDGSGAGGQRAGSRPRDSRRGRLRLHADGCMVRDVSCPRLLRSDCVEIDGGRRRVLAPTSWTPATKAST